MERKALIIIILIAVVAVVVLAGSLSGEITFSTVTAQDEGPGPTPIPTIAPSVECYRTTPCECPGRACIRISGEY